ncbi:MAG TPA: hypothetical protein VH855_14380 [Acetobacteraceae bacterium]
MERDLLRIVHARCTQRGRCRPTVDEIVQWAGGIGSATDIVQIERKAHQDGAVVAQQRDRISRAWLQASEQFAEVDEPQCGNGDPGELTVAIDAMAHRDRYRIVACGRERPAHERASHGLVALRPEVIPVGPVLQFLARARAGHDAAVGTDHVDEADVAVTGGSFAQQCVSLLRC